MTDTEGRLGRIESEVRFRLWFHKRRMFEAMSIEELETLAVTGHWPDRPEPGPGASKLDEMNREDLIKLWKEALRQFAGRNGDEMEFYAIHGHWPERGCNDECQARKSSKPRQ